MPLCSSLRLMKRRYRMARLTNGQGKQQQCRPSQEIGLNNSNDTIWNFALPSLPKKMILESRLSFMPLP
jgi:hypothetical protein